MINEAVKEPSAATAQGARQHARSAQAFSFICSLIHSDASASPSVRQSARWPCGCMHWGGGGGGGRGNRGARCWKGRAATSKAAGRSSRIASGVGGGVGVGGRIVLLTLPEFTKGGSGWGRGGGHLICPLRVNGSGTELYHITGVTGAAAACISPPQPLSQTHSLSRSLSFLFLHFVLVCARPSGCWWPS